LDVATQFSGGKASRVPRIIFNITLQSHVVDIQPFSDLPEAEILMLPGRNLQVTATESKIYIQVVNRSEIAPNLMLIQLTEVTGPLILTGIALPVLAAPSPRVVVGSISPGMVFDFCVERREKEVKGGRKKSLLVGLRNLKLITSLADISPTKRYLFQNKYHVDRMVEGCLSAGQNK
jgi:hypothetical protein